MLLYDFLIAIMKGAQADVEMVPSADAGLELAQGSGEDEARKRQPAHGPISDSAAVGAFAVDVAEKPSLEKSSAEALRRSSLRKARQAGVLWLTVEFGIMGSRT